MLQLTTILFLISFSTLAIIHGIAMHLFLYWSVSWFDIPMHLFGGVIVALGFFTLRDLNMFPNSWLKPLPVVFLVFVVAVCWEVFEVVFGIANQVDYPLDTVSDLVFGVVGGIAGFFIGNSVRKLR